MLTAAISTKVMTSTPSHTKRAGLWIRTTPLYWNNTACTITLCPHDIGSYCNQKNKRQKFAVSFHLIIYNKTELKLSGEQALL